MQKAWLIVLFLEMIVACKSNLMVQEVRTENISNSENLHFADPAVTRLVEPYKSKLTNKMNEVIAVSTDEMIKARPESKLTNYLGDLLLEEGKRYAEQQSLAPLPFIAFLNYGGLRTALPKGKITVGNIYELMPFENEMVLLKLKGEDVQRFAEKIAYQGGDCVAGIKLGIRQGKLSDLQINGEPLETNKEYWMVTNDYVANGGDDMEMFANHLEYVETGIKLRDCIIGYMRKESQAGKKIAPKLDSRIYIE
ncbi:MAG: 5'-nucleotidase C-terminal domain-containing protein [Mangrovibacterium sp.]